MKKNKGLAIFVSLLAAGAVFAYFINSVLAQSSGDASVLRQTDDAIGVRVVPNPNHFSVYRWYESQGFKGSPQALTVDGYEALRDGRTVYVNSANIDTATKAIYTNIYLISYNQDPDVKTVDILGQIVSHWKFNDNLPKDIATCSISAVKCEKDSDCSSTQICSNITGTCALKEVKNCLVDENCPANFFCDSLKAKVIRDAKRVGKLEELREALAKYRTSNNHYPLLTSGTYLPGKTTSLWPSWNDVLMPSLSIKQVISDPINRLGLCPGFDAKTCWDKTKKQFVYDASNSSLQLPKDSYAMVYSTNDAGSDYNLCAVLESRDSYNSNLGYHFTPNDPSASECVSATGILASGNVSNSAPKIIDLQLKGWSGREYNGFVRASDPEKDPLTWNMTAVSTSWPNWRGAPPILKGTSDLSQKKIFADMAGDPGTYLINLTVSDNKGASVSTTTRIEIIPSSSFAQADDYVYRLDPAYPFNYTLYVAGSTASPSYSITRIGGSGGDILAMPRIVKTVSSDGNNRLRINYQGSISTSTRFTSDINSIYSLVVDGKAANNFNIGIKIDKPILDFNCPTQSRPNMAYSCLLGSTKQNNHTITYYSVNVLPAGLSILPDKEKPEMMYLIGTTTQAQVGKEIKIRALNEYGTDNLKSFILNVNTYCGDGIAQAPNTEGKGGVFNNGYESCDGLSNVATGVSDSSKTRQYACNTAVGASTPYPISANSYCIFKSPLDGGGYCGDTFCQLKYEAIATCGFDCDPNYFNTSTTPTLPGGGTGGGNIDCNSGVTCDPGYQCASSGVCEKKCWQQPVSGSSVVVEEGDAVLPGVTYYEEVNAWDHYTYNSYQIVDTSAGSVKSCTQGVNHGALTPSSGCTVIRIDNGECFISPCFMLFYPDYCTKNGVHVDCSTCTFRGQVNSCPVGYRANFNAATGGYPSSTLHPGYGGACGVDNSNSWPDRESILCTSASTMKTVCYLDSCITSAGKTGKINSDGTCIPDTPCTNDGACADGQTCTGYYAHCENRKPQPDATWDIPNSGSLTLTVDPCEDISRYQCNNNPDCKWTIDEPGVCVSSASSGGAQNCKTCDGSYCGSNNCGASCPCPTSDYSCNNNQCTYLKSANIPQVITPPTSCSPGTYITPSQSSCVPCPAGFYCADGKTATICPPGSYTTTTGNSSCLTCETGYYCPGQSSKTGCEPGTYRDKTGGMSTGNCFNCVAGTYTDTRGNSLCADCVAGTYNTVTHSTGCNQCDAGYYCTGKTNITACPAGTARSQTGGTSLSSCSSCSAGSYSSGTANISCTYCSAGTYSSGTKNTSCTTCSPGYYNTGTGNTTCTKCEANYVCTGGASRSSCSSLTGGAKTASNSGSDSVTDCFVAGS